MPCTERETTGHELRLFADEQPLVTSKAVGWGQLSAGDCHQSGGALTFNSDGTGLFACTTWTDHTHSGDYWHSSFSVLNSAGAVIFTLGQYNSPRMSDGGPSYYWTQAFTFQAAQYDAIASVTQTYSC